MFQFSQEVLENELNRVAKAILSRLKGSHLIFFEGEPGAGKTTLINEMLKQLELQPSSSPTFSLHNRIQTKDFKIDHFDLYRIENVDELETTGLWDAISECQSHMAESASHFVFIEWANKFDSSIWPIELPQMKIEITNGSKIHSRFYQIRQIR